MFNLRTQPFGTYLFPTDPGYAPGSGNGGAQFDAVETTIALTATAGSPTLTSTVTGAFAGIAALLQKLTTLDSGRGVYMMINNIGLDRTTNNGITPPDLGSPGKFMIVKVIGVSTNNLTLTMASNAVSATTPATPCLVTYGTDDTGPIAACLADCITKGQPMGLVAGKSLCATGNALSGMALGGKSLSIVGPGKHDCKIIAGYRTNPGSGSFMTSIHSVTDANAWANRLLRRGWTLCGRMKFTDYNEYVSLSTLSGFQEIIDDDFHMEYSGYFTSVIRNCNKASFINSKISYSCRDGWNCSASHIVVSHSRFEAVGDDSCVANTFPQQTNAPPVREGVTVGTCWVIRGGSINVESPRSTVVTGCTIIRGQGRGIVAAQAIYGEGEAQQPSMGLIIAGNIGIDMLRLHGVSSAYPWTGTYGTPDPIPDFIPFFIAISTPQARKGTSPSPLSNTIPGIPSGGLVTSPYLFLQDNNPAFTAAMPPGYALTVANNTCVRTLPIDGTNLSTKGLALAWDGHYGVMDPPLNQDVIAQTVGVLIYSPMNGTSPAGVEDSAGIVSMIVDGLLVSRMMVQGIGNAIFILPGVSLINSLFDGNRGCDFTYSSGSIFVGGQSIRNGAIAWAIAPAGANPTTTTLRIANSDFNGDPFFACSIRAGFGGTLTGGWTYASGAVGRVSYSALFNVPGKGVELESNSFANWNQIVDTSSGSTPQAWTNTFPGVIAGRNNVIKCTPAAVGNNASNLGVRDIMAPGMWRHIGYVCDPSATTYGTMANECPDSAMCDPVTGLPLVVIPGYYVAGQYVNNSSAASGLGQPSGWSRGSSGYSATGAGNGHELGIDWLPTLGSGAETFEDHAASYTPNQGDIGTTLCMTNAGAANLTFVSLAPSTRFTVRQFGAGTTSFVASGVTLIVKGGNTKMGAAGSAVNVFYHTATSVMISGDTAP